MSENGWKVCGLGGAPAEQPPAGLLGEVDLDRGDAAGSRRAGRAREALPLGAAVPRADAAGYFTGGGAHPRGVDERVEVRAHTPARSRSATVRTASATAGATEASNTLGTM